MRYTHTQSESRKQGRASALSHKAGRWVRKKWEAVQLSAFFVLLLATGPPERRTLNAQSSPRTRITLFILAAHAQYVNPRPYLVFIIFSRWKEIHIILHSHIAQKKQSRNLDCQRFLHMRLSIVCCFSFSNNEHERDWRAVGRARADIYTKCTQNSLSFVEQRLLMHPVIRGEILRQTRPNWFIFAQTKFHQRVTT